MMVLTSWNHFHCNYRKAKTHRGKRELERRGPRLIENTKQGLFLRGTKCSETVKKLLKDIVSAFCFNTL